MPVAGARLDCGHVDRGRVHGGADPPGPQAIDRAVARHAHDPRQRSAHPRVVCLGSRPHPDERLLQDLLRLPAIADDAQDETEEQPAVAIVQLRQCGGIARGDALQEAEVSGIAGVHHASAENSFTQIQSRGSTVGVGECGFRETSSYSTRQIGSIAFDRSITRQLPDLEPATEQIGSGCPLVRPNPIRPSTRSGLSARKTGRGHAERVAAHSRN